MIRFALNCSSDHGFEGWFKSGDAFTEQAEAGRSPARPAATQR